MLGLRFCARAFSSRGKRGPLLIAMRGPLTVAASPTAEHRLQTRRLSSCGSQAQPLRGMWDLPRPGLEPASPALAGGLSTTAPPGKPQKFLILMKSSLSIISFMDVFGFVSQKALPYPRSSRFSLMLSSRSFMVFHFTLRPLIHFEFIFVKGVRSVSRFFFFFLHVDVQLFQHHLLKRQSLLHCIAFDPLSRSDDYIYGVYFKVALAI